MRHNIVYPSNVVSTLTICFLELSLAKKLVLSSSGKQMVPKDGLAETLAHVS